MDMMFEAYLFQEPHQEETAPASREPIWILGRKYHPHRDRESVRRDVRSRLWFSYRKGFKPIGDSGLTSDKGWGCMLRCGQMLLAQAFMLLKLGRDWSWNSHSQERQYLEIVDQFADRRGSRYSIHQIALTGASEGKQVGDWFGPNTIAQVLKKLAVSDDVNSVVVHVALDNTIIKNDIKRQCRCARRGWKPVVLIVPLRLGINQFNPLYINPLKACFTFGQSLGVIGGRPNHALYFIGFVGNDAIFLDPHTTQATGVVGAKLSEEERKVDWTYHCSQARRLHIPSMDPSVAVAFLARSEEDFDLLCEDIGRRMVAECEAPLFELREERAPQWSPPIDERAEDAAAALAQSWCGRQFDDSDEDFELLG